MERWSTLGGREPDEKRKQTAPHDFGSVMVVDDEPVDLFLAERVIEASLGNVRVHKFGNGPNAIGMLKALEEPEKFPGLIVVDMRMPDMGGEDFLKELRQLKRFNPEECCVIMLSAFFNYHEQEEINRIGRDFPFVSKCLRKPFKAEMIPGNREPE